MARVGPLAGQSFRFSLDAELGKHIESKADAKTEADRIRSEIRAGTFVRAKDRVAAPAAVDGGSVTTVEQLGETYFKTYINRKTGGKLSKNERYRWDLIMRTEITRPGGLRLRFGALDVRTVTRHDVEAFKAVHLTPRVETFTDAKGREHTWRRGGPVGVNRCVGRLRSFYSWAVKADYVPATPFKKGTETIVEMYGERKRERRLTPDVVDEKGKLKIAGEERRLLAAANPHLQSLIVAALETGCRVGELLSLQWSQVRFDLNEIHLPAKKTKALRPRFVPMSQRLKALLEMRRVDPNDEEGKDYPSEAYVFGDTTGAQMKSVKTAWENAVLKAHDVEVKREATGRLTAACREAFASIDLNFHDLRREAGSRFLEAGMAPHYVQAFLDHANLSTTSRYLNVTGQGMHAALKRVEHARNLIQRPTQTGDTVESTNATR
ncbi:MAG TPA: site-specific integrase [Vicinamibacterales bacterium]|nr:site-specific integrase [Vicinamibacterales bacterium]